MKTHQLLVAAGCLAGAMATPVTAVAVDISMPMNEADQRIILNILDRATSAGGTGTAEQARETVYFYNKIDALLRQARADQAAQRDKDLREKIEKDVRDKAAAETAKAAEDAVKARTPE